MSSTMSGRRIAERGRGGSLVLDGFAACLLLAGLFAAGTAIAREPDTDPSETGTLENEARALAERVLELRRAERQLLEGLSPALVAEVERLLAEAESGGLPAGEAEFPVAEELPVAEPPVVESPVVESPVVESPVIETPVIEAPVIEVPAEATSLGEPPADREPAAAAGRSGSPCPGLSLLDFDGDGELSGADRYWRYLHLWLDDGDGRMEEGETPTLYEAGVRSVGLELRAWEGAGEEGGDVRVDERVLFEIPAGGTLREAILLLDAGGVARGDELSLLGPSGEGLAGMVEVRSEVRVSRQPEGEPLPLLCGR